MAGYHIYSLDWDKFRRFVDEPSPTQLLAFAGQISDGLDEFDGELREGDPVRGWPSDPEELCDLVRRRLAQREWYGDLSDAGKSVWERGVIAFSERRARGDSLGFRVESDGVYWDVIDIARRHHGLPPDRITDAVVSHFGTRPYRYNQPTDRPRRWGDWFPTHSMHTPEEVGRLLRELKEAGPSILSAPQERPRIDYGEELLPTVEKVARARRLLYIAVDT
jgi:hypothetical protein